jgi:hypothetical protein
MTCALLYCAAPPAAAIALPGGDPDCPTVTSATTAPRTTTAALTTRLSDPPCSGCCLPLHQRYVDCQCDCAVSWWPAPSLVLCVVTSCRLGGAAPLMAPLFSSVCLCVLSPGPFCSPSPVTGTPFKLCHLQPVSCVTFNPFLVTTPGRVLACQCTGAPPTACEPLRNRH